MELGESPAPVDKSSANLADEEHYSGSTLIEFMEMCGKLICTLAQ